MSGVNQCNGGDNVGGQSVECTVTVTNRLDEASSQGSSTVEVKECHGAANTVPTCTTTSTESDALVTTVKQCNGSGNGGGGTVDCTVNIVNVVTGTAGTTSAATVNQCITAGEGGGTQPTFVCDPLGSTTNADVTQCNGSGNGGGGSERVTCDVGASVVTSKIPVSVDQCNGSGNGGGATVTCSTTLSYTLLAAVAGPTPTPTVSPTPTPTPSDGTTPPVNDGTPSGSNETPPSTDVHQEADSSANTLAATGTDLHLAPFALALLLAGGAFLVVARRRMLLSKTAH